MRIIRTFAFRHPVGAIALCCTVLISLLTAQAVLGMPDQLTGRHFPSEQVFNVISGINAANGAPMEHSSVVFHQGYVVEVYSEENTRPRAGIAVFDIADPYSPRLVAGTEEGTERLSEQHAIGFSNSDGHEYAALLAIDGIEIWDWSDVMEMQPVAHLELPGISPGYGSGAWWLFWQAPILYVSGASNGIFIVDVSDPARPFLVDRGDKPNPLPNSATGGFRTGPVFAVGNLLVVSSNDGRGYATLDISDPRNPVLLDSIVAGSPPSYSTMVNGNRIYAAGTDDDFHGLDISNPHEIRILDSVPMGGKGGYLTVQDNYAHVGASNHYVKIDLSDDDEYTVVGRATSNVEHHDEDFAVVLGNLVILSDDRYNGSFIFPHQAEPDTTGPEVNMVNPPDGAGGQFRTSRIGLTFTDRIDLRTVGSETFIVRAVDGGDPISGRYSSQTNIVNFTPDRPLQADTTYEVVVPSGGIRDVAGNPVPRTVQTTFSTGESAGSSFLCQVSPTVPVAVGESAKFSVEIVAGGGNIAYEWSFGDDSPGADVGFSPRTNHAYGEPGHYTVRATAHSGSQATTCAALQTVYRRTLPGTAPSSSSIVLDRSGTQVWNVNPDNDTVTAVNAVTLEKMWERSVGDDPRTLAQSPDGSIWVVNRQSASISILHNENGDPLGNISLPAGSLPHGIVFSPDGRASYVTLEATGQLAKLDPTQRSVIGYLDVGSRPRGLSIAVGSDRIFVSRYISPATQGEVVEIDAQSFQVSRVIALTLDPGPDTESSGRGLPNGLNSPAFSPDGRRLWIPSNKDNTERGFQRDGKQLTFESTVRTIVSQIDVETGQEVMAARHDFNNRAGAIAVAFSPLGDYAFVLLRESNAIDVLDAYSGQFVTSIEGVGRAPLGMAFTFDGTKLFVHSWLTRSVIVYDVSNIVRPGTLRAKRLAELPVVAQESLSEDVLRGKQIFYNAEDSRMGRDEYLTCSSCHLDEADDGRVWDRTAEGEGLRNTISLIGQGNLTGRMHWSGNFDEIQDFEHDMRDSFGGTGFLPEPIFQTGSTDAPLGDAKAGLSPELDALAAFVLSLTDIPASPHRGSKGTLTPEAQAGKQLFEELRCGACHGGPNFSDSATGMVHDVGTLKESSGQRLGTPLFGIDTPSLHYLWQTAPYFHDGSAQTLYEVFAQQPSLRPHGDFDGTLAANKQALDDIIAYLLQLDGTETGPPLPSPAIEIIRPAVGDPIPATNAVKIAVDTTPVLGAVERIEFYADGQLLGHTKDPLERFIWIEPALGKHQIGARLLYENGYSSTANPVDIIIMP